MLLFNFRRASCSNYNNQNFRAVRVRFDKYKAEHFDFGKKIHHNEKVVDIYLCI